MKILKYPGVIVSLLSSNKLGKQLFYLSDLTIPFKCKYEYTKNKLLGL